VYTLLLLPPPPWRAARREQRPPFFLPRERDICEAEACRPAARVSSGERQRSHSVHRTRSHAGHTSREGRQQWQVQAGGVAGVIWCRHAARCGAVCGVRVRARCAGARCSPSRQRVAGVQRKAQCSPTAGYGAAVRSAHTLPRSSRQRTGVYAFLQRRYGGAAGGAQCSRRVML